ncbi:MAG TPA: SGNH/GDSL hydrolase family protein [Gemmatimonadales bacterium]|nr:SGNH/GDSL hydrolase family protein [Gemmatimonadales bacterium]
MQRGLNRVDRATDLIGPADPGWAPSVRARLERLIPQNRTGVRQILIRCVAVGGGLLAGLVAAEGLLRALGAAPTDGVTTVTEQEFRSVPGILSPGQHVIDRRDPRLPHRVSTNSLGYRGKEVAARKAPGELRILFTGDSFVYGDFVNDDQTLPAQLEGRLNGRCADVRVVNAGLGDATIVDEAQLIDRGLRLSPDLVILLFGENDIADLNRPSTWDRLATNRRAKSRFPLGTLYPLLRRTAVWNFALAVRATWRARAQARHTTGGSMLTAAGSADPVTHELREAYRRALLAVRDTLARRGVPLVLVAYPSHMAVTHEAMRDQIAWVTRTAAAANVFEVNLLGPLAASGLPAETLYLLPYDGHPSPRGYEIAAAYLADQLLAAGPLAAACRARGTGRRLEDRVDEGRQRGSVREDEQRADDQHDQHDRQQPPLLPHPHEGP